MDKENKSNKNISLSNLHIHVEVYFGVVWMLRNFRNSINGHLRCLIYGRQK